MKFHFAAGLLLAIALDGALLLAQNPINTAATPPPPPEEPIFDPLRAEKSMEVGRYYMRKHNYDAAIERFSDAVRSRPNLAEPHLLMGEAYEKKGEKAEAVKSYLEYLKIVPNAPDGDKIRKHIAALNDEIRKTSKRKSR